MSTIAVGNNFNGALTDCDPGYIELGRDADSQCWHRRQHLEPDLPGGIELFRTRLFAGGRLSAEGQPDKRERPRLRAGSQHRREEHHASTVETFRVPFADLDDVGFFLDDTPGSGVFDNRNVDLEVESVSTANSMGTANIVTPINVARGAVVALLTVAETALGSNLGKLTINSSLDRQSAIVSGGSIGKSAAGTGLSVGAVTGILASVGPMRVIRIGTTSGAWLYEQNDETDASIDSIFSKGITPVSPTDPFDQATPEDLLDLAKLLANLSGLSVVEGKLI
jgi:hypothetical protein